MVSAPALTTTVSTKGQVILPKAVRDRRNWGPGAKLIVEETADGVLLRAAPLFPRTTIDQVFGCLQWDGPPKTIEEMDAAVTEEVQQRHAGGRY